MYTLLNCLFHVSDSVLTPTSCAYEESLDGEASISASMDGLAAESDPPAEADTKANPENMPTRKASQNFNPGVWCVHQPREQMVPG